MTSLQKQAMLKAALAARKVFKPIKQQPVQPSKKQEKQPPRLLDLLDWNNYAIN